MAVNNFITHRLGLYKTAFDLSEDGNLVDIDYSVSGHGHLLVKKDRDDYRILIKALTDIAPIPISQNELDNFDKFFHIFLTTGIYTKNYELFSIPINEAKKLIKTNFGPDGTENRWIDTDKYSKFKVSKFTLP
jgi:hypothetical protein